MNLSKSEWLAKIKDYPSHAGVYLMKDVSGHVIYVGKANVISKRLQSYFAPKLLHVKTEALVKHICHIDYVLTSNALQALIIEQDLIKKYRPKYNISLKDDKSYPYIMLTSDKYPRLSLIRGSIDRFVHRHPNATFLGPFPQSHAAVKTIEWIQKALQLRNCRDYDFTHRSRPCLQYQIKRCKAPCVGYVSEAEYGEDAEIARYFLVKNHGPLKEKLTDKMNNASQDQRYEDALNYRDMLQFVERSIATDYIRKQSMCVDIWGAVAWLGQYLVGLLQLKDGVVNSVRFFDPFTLDEPDAWDSILCTYYHSTVTDLPNVIRVTGDIDGQLFSTWLKDVHGKSMGRINAKHLKTWTALLYNNLEDKIQVMNRVSGVLPLSDYNEFLAYYKLSTPWIVSMDISHISGAFTIGSMESFIEGKRHAPWCKTYTLKPASPGSDVEAMHLLVKKMCSWFKRINRMPDVYIVDGALPQMEAVRKVLTLHLKEGDMFAVSKGPKRIWGDETIYHSSNFEQTGHVTSLADNIRHTVLRMRDCSHAAANGKHRKVRTKAQTMVKSQKTPINK